MPGEGLLDVRMIGVAAKIDTHEGVTIAGTTINATDLYVRYCAKEFRSLQRLWPGLVHRVECDEICFAGRTHTNFHKATIDAIVIRYDDSAPYLYSI